MVNGRRFPPSWRGRYPHMREDEMALWNRFLDRYGDGFTSFEYDARLGAPSGAARGFDAGTVAVFEALTKLRVDAVGYGPEEVWLFEVMPSAGLSAVGKIIGYRDLFVAERRPALPVRLGVVTDRFQPAVGEVFAAEGVEAWVV